MITDKLSIYRPTSFHLPYPPYHKNEYLEEFFYKYLINNQILTTKVFIPVYWTECYLQKKLNGLQKILDELNDDLLYFTVSQHDDAILEKLPKKTQKFCAGGNSGGIPIPLVCSKIPDDDKKCYRVSSRDLLCSFHGSITHRIRQRMVDHLKNKPNISINTKKWSQYIDKQNYFQYIYYAMRSKFLLCPRGYGLNSFRLYESFQLGCVPVIVTDKLFLPWCDELNWTEFAIIISDTSKIYDTLVNISNEQYRKMLYIGQTLYEDYFTLEGTCKQIIKRVNKL